MTEIIRKPKTVTGGNSESQFTHKLCNFDKYLILVKLTLDGKFVGIEEVAINEDFRSLKDRKTQGTSVDINELPSE